MPAGPRFFLRAAVHQIKFFPRNRARHILRRHVADERYLNFRPFGHADAADGLVGGDVQVAGAAGGGERDLAARRHAGVAAIGAVPGGVDVAVAGAVGDRAFGPRAGIDVRAFAAVVQQVHRDHGKLQHGAALEKQDAEVVRGLIDFQRQRHGFIGHRLKMLAAMAHLDQGHARALVVNEFLLGLFENGEGQGARPGAEIVFSVLVLIGHGLCSGNVQVMQREREAAGSLGIDAIQ